MHGYKYETWALIFFFLAAMSWCVLFREKFVNMGFGFLDLCFALTILFVDFFFVCICKRIAGKRGKKISAYRVFAVTDALIGLIIAVYAVWDICMENEWSMGLVGIFLLIFVLPVVLLFLVLDYLLWELQK